MKEFIIGENDCGQRVDKFLAKAVPLLPTSLRNKYIRIKRIKLFGKRVEADYKLQLGDVLSCYINDEFFEKPSEKTAFLKASSDIDVIYEDNHILLVNKKVGVSVHADEKQQTNTLIDMIQSYLYKKGEYIPENENSFAPSLCNRIDRNTQGIVIAAKTAAALRILNQKIKDREIEKLYLAVVIGKMEKNQGEIENFLLKNSETNTVKAYRTRVVGAKTAKTVYKTIKTRDDLSLVQCKLITGRTHQIRVHMSGIGHPLLGDGKYGSNKDNQPYGEKYQALCSYKLKFAFTSEAHELNYLKNREFTLKNIDFVDKYFRGAI